MTEIMQQQPKIEISSLSLQELEAAVVELGQPKFRAGQIFSWLHQKQVESFDEMSNLSIDFRNKLADSYRIAKVAELRRQTSKDGTIKFLFELFDGNTVESVLMLHDYGTSLCVSSQVGCRMGCKFCASTIGGRVRNLTAGEILGQIYAAARLSGKKIDSLVMMGMGEPLDNFENVIAFLELVRHPKGLCLSHRHISLSTCGVVDKIDLLATYNYQLTLSVSLHAYNNKKRSEIMPVNDSFNIERLMKACKDYFKTTSRRISYEYSLIAGVNDQEEDARGLIALLKGQGCHVNLIPINAVAETGFLRSDKRQAYAFRDILIKGGVSATIRRELGGDIDAACGQLRRNETQGGNQ